MLFNPFVDKFIEEFFVFWFFGKIDGFFFQKKFVAIHGVRICALEFIFGYANRVTFWVGIR